MVKEIDILYTSIEEITEKLAQIFQEITSNLKYDPQLLIYKDSTELLCRVAQNYFLNLEWVSNIMSHL